MATKTKKKKEITLDDLALMMGRGFNEVHEKMDRKFTKVDEKFSEVHEKMDKGFAGVYQEMDRRFTEVDREISGLKEGFSNLQTSVDGYAKKADSYFQEMVMLSHKVDRVERWVLQLAEKAGVQLKA